MKTAIVYSSATGNTKALAETIEKKVSDLIYTGTVDDKALDADVIYVGFWAKAFSCGDDIKGFLEKCKGKKIFLFGTAGYDDTQEYFDKILTAVKENIDSSNTVTGEFLCMGKVSTAKQNAIKEMDEAKFNNMKPNMDRAESHPDQADLDNLAAKIG